MSELSVIKKEYAKIEAALKEVNEFGYGIVTPDIDDLTLEEPEIVKQAGGYGVKLRASAPSIHIERIKQKYKIRKRTARFKPGSYANLQYRNIYESFIIT
jgi:stage IV sporulation protein A